MRLLATLLAAIFVGIGGHATRRHIDHYFGSEVYRRLASYALGVLILQPVSMLVSSRLERVEHSGERLLTSNILAACMVGLGVGSGYLLDIVSKD